MGISIEVWALLALSMAAGLVAGVFLTFSDFVMKSLQASRPDSGTEAMQIINRKVYRSIFMGLLLGLFPLSVTVAIYAGLFMPQPVAGWLVTGGLLYAGGVFLVTVVGNVPMNKRLDALPLAGDSARAYWPVYVKGWMRWNHVRWITALGAAVSYAVGAVLLAAT